MPEISCPQGKRPGPASAPRSYEIHRLLDPFLPSRSPWLARQWVRLYRQLKRGEIAGESLFLRQLGPVDRDRDLSLEVRDCLADVDHYLDDVLQYLPAERQDRLRPSRAIREVNDPGQLLEICFTAEDPWTRFEAQRKLYLGRLLFSIDHWRGVRDGQRHKAILEKHIMDTLLAKGHREPNREICCRIDHDRMGDPRLVLAARTEAQARCWHFSPWHIPSGQGEPDLEIFDFMIRFKREARRQTDGDPHPTPLGYGLAERWPTLGRRSGSILSKMIRRGLTDPRQVQDVLGAMFIVADRKQAYALENRLLSLLGGPAWAHDRTDTLGGEKDRKRLSQRSAPGFEVLKETVDVLVNGDAFGPYQFAVEIQIYPLASYLGTIHDGHVASHAAYKRRQFEQDIIPALFPVVAG